MPLSCYWHITDKKITTTQKQWARPALMFAEQCASLVCHCHAIGTLQVKKQTNSEVGLHSCLPSCALVWHATIIPLAPYSETAQRRHKPQNCEQLTLSVSSFSALAFSSSCCFFKRSVTSAAVLSRRACHSASLVVWAGGDNRGIFSAGSSSSSSSSLSSCVSDLTVWVPTTCVFWNTCALTVIPLLIKSKSV